mgnify:CR=1 FL=1
MSLAGAGGQIVSHYEVLGPIGQGAMGRVVKARDRNLGRVVALKFLASRYLDAPEARERFFREARTISSLSHPNIATIYAIEESGGEPFLALEYLSGGSLDERARGRQLPLPELLAYARQLAAGLDHAHRHGVIHRDVKPANVLFSGDGQLKLVDFGLAKWLHGPADALEWLQDPRGHLDDSRQDLLAAALERLGRFKESSPIRQRMFERTLSDFYLQRWLEHLPEAARPEAMARARTLALRHDDLTAAATLLLQLGDADAAEARLLAEPARIDGNHYGRLVPLAKTLRAHECPRGETVVYRALLRGILDRAYVRAYGHAARYWARLVEIARSGGTLSPLPSHEDFEAEIRARHGRKSAFWAYVNGTRNDVRDEPDGITS